MHELRAYRVQSSKPLQTSITYSSQTCIHFSKQETQKYSYMARDKQLVAQESGFQPGLWNLWEGVSCWARGRIARTTGANLLQAPCPMLSTQRKAERQHT